jgi:hypothetical protein
MTKYRRLGILAVVVLGGQVLVDVSSAAQTAVPQTPAAQTAPRPAPRTPVTPPASATPPGAITPPPRPPKAGEVSSDPIRCWWKADRTAVRVGERFNLVLTCSVIETGPVTVAPVLNQLEPGALSLTPFEVVNGGPKVDDVISPPWRFIQREYVVRLLSDGFFGQDVAIPALTVTYNLTSAGSGQQGRDQQYILPALPMRILSLVPKSAGDIRDASGQTFATIESRRFRASAATIAGWICFAFAGVLAIFALTRVVGMFRVRDAQTVKPLPASSLLGASLKTLSQVKEDAVRAGWSPDLSRRAVAALRVAGATAVGKRVAQDVVAASVSQRDGQLSIARGWPKRKRVLLSAATTPMTISYELNNGHRADTRTRESAESIAQALTVLSAAGYGRTSPEDAAALDAALDDSTRAVRRLRTGTLWPSRATAAMKALIGL